MSIAFSQRAVSSEAALLRLGPSLESRGDRRKDAVLCTGRRVTHHPGSGAVE